VGVVAAEGAPERLQDILLDRLRRYRYPSPGMLDLTERAISVDGQRRDEYLDALIDKIDDVQYPSPELIRRVLRLVGG
jgi:hypothetical protein